MNTNLVKVPSMAWGLPYNSKTTVTEVSSNNSYVKRKNYTTLY